MPTFKERIEDLSGTIPVTADGEQFVKDGVSDVVNRITITSPQNADLFTSETAVADGGTAIDSTRILGVHRDSSSCRLIASSSRHSAVDSGSIHYATASDPVYYVLDQSIYVKPTGGSSVQASIVQEGTVTNWDAGSSAIANFPDENYNQVVMYAAMQVLHHRMVVSTMPTNLTLTTVTAPSITAVVPDSPTIAEVNYSGPSTLDVGAVADITAATITGISTAPAYDGGTVVGFGSLLTTLAQKTITDLTITAVPPEVPSVPNFTVPAPSLQNSGALSGINKTLSGVAPIYAAPSPTLSLEAFSAFAGTITNLTVTAVPPDVPVADIPEYIAPTIAGGSGADDLSDMIDSSWSVLDFDFDDENIDFATWFQTAGAMIQNQEDIELASMQLQKIAAYVNSYSIAIQNRLNVFNTKLQDHSAAQGLYQAELGQYQQEVNAQVGEYTQNLGKAIQTWSGEQQNELARFSALMQNAMNVFNDANIEYQATLQGDMTELQSQVQADISIMNKSSDIDVQAKSQVLQQESNEYTAEITRYQAQLQEYQQEVGAQVQEYQANTQKDMSLYQAEQSNALQQHAQSMQDAMNLFGDANAEYQTTFQQGVQNAQLSNAAKLANMQKDLQIAIGNEDRDQQRQLQNAVQATQAIISDNGNLLGKYQAEVAAYQQEVGTQVSEYGQNVQRISEANSSAIQDFGARVQKASGEYQWLQGQLGMVAQQYNQSFMAAPQGVQ